MTNEDPNEVHVFEFYDDEPEPLEAKLPKFIDDYNDVNFEKDLNDEQLEIINNLKGPMLVIAGAGSGKTRTIVYAVAKLLKSGVRPGEIMLVTFTNKAASEMIKRVEVLLGKRPKGIWAGTFHSMANRFLRTFTRAANLKDNFTIMDEQDSFTLMKLAMKSAGTAELEERFPTPKMTKAMLSFMINCNKPLEDVINWKYPDFSSDKILDKISKVFKVYEKKKLDSGLLDFDDLLTCWNILLDQESIAKLIANRIKYVLVDEYQDTNHLQDEIISKIVAQNPQKNIMVVGDDAQSIYAFRGANFQNILNFEEQYDDCKRYTITYNYRSVPEILTLANNSILHNVDQFQKDMQPVRKEGIKPFHVKVEDDLEQARFITHQILKLRNEGYALEEMGILVRAGFHTTKIELQLKEKNIPYVVRAGVSFFEKAHIRDIIAHLRIIENPHDEVSWTRVFNYVQGLGSTSASKIFSIISTIEDPIKEIIGVTFPRKIAGSRIPKEGLKNFISHVKNLADLSPEDDPAHVIESLVDVLQDQMQSKFDNWEDRIQDLMQLAAYANSFPTINKFLDQMTLNMSNLQSRSVKAGMQKEEERPLVISTIHRAKGLEWRVVFIPMLCEDMFPSSRVVGQPEEFEEERRVFYVAVTRAKDQLYLISPSIVQSFGNFLTARDSQFVSELDENTYKKAIVEYKSRIEEDAEIAAEMKKLLVKKQEKKAKTSRSPKKKSKSKPKKKKKMKKVKKKAKKVKKSKKTKPKKVPLEAKIISMARENKGIITLEEIIEKIGITIGKAKKIVKKLQKEKIIKKIESYSEGTKYHFASLRK